MKKSLLFLFVGSCFWANAQSNSSISVTGLNSDDEGVFAHSHYPNAFGHLIPAPYDAFGNDTAYYYLSSSDYGSVNPSSTSGFHATGVNTGFTQLNAALSHYNRNISEIKVQFDGLSLGLDRKGIEWDLKGDTETREYAGGRYAILLNNDTILTGVMPTLTMTIDYNNEATPFDDQISAESHYSVPSNVLSGNAEIDSIAKAFYNDCKDYGLMFEFTSVQPAGQTEYRTPDLVGAFFEIPTGYIKTGDVQIPNFGDTIYACVGSSELLDAGSFDAYMWSDGSVNQTLNVTSSGSYYVVVTKTGIEYTSEETEIIFDNCTNLSSVLNENYTVYPNPATNTVVVRGADLGSNFEVLDLEGKVLIQGVIRSSNFNLDVSHLSSGVYFIQTNQAQLKLVKR